MYGDFKLNDIKKWWNFIYIINEKKNWENNIRYVENF